MNKYLIIFSIAILVACQNQHTNQEKKSNTSSKNAVYEKTFIELGGEEQYVEIKGASDQLPVLLFLHGGPGWPQTPHLRYFNSDLTKEMILVSWDQAGCGQSYMINPTPKNLSPESLLDDAHELTQYLKKKYNKKKVFLLGFSYGSVIGLQLANKYPEDYYAYIGVSQLINSKESWDASMQWLTEQAKLKNAYDDLKQLKVIEKGDTSIYKTSLDRFMAKYQLLVKYNGTIYHKEMAKEIEKAEHFYDDYKGYDWFEAFNYTSSRFEEKQFYTNLSGIKSLEIPVYFMSGRHDWNLPGIVTENYMNNKLNAPNKKIIWFENSGHEPPEEEAQKFNKIIIDIVKEKSR